MKQHVEHMKNDVHKQTELNGTPREMILRGEASLEPECWPYDHCQTTLWVAVILVSGESRSGTCSRIVLIYKKVAEPLHTCPMHSHQGWGHHEMRMRECQALSATSANKLDSANCIEQFANEA